MKVKIVNHSPYPLPSYATLLSAGMDMRANVDSALIIKPLERVLVPTGIFIALPPGYEAQIRPRSGMASKKGIGVLNSPGTIDADYRGEVKIILVNISDQPVTIEPGERIAQMIVAAFTRVEWEEAQVLDATERGAGGFGSTGTQDLPGRVSE